MKNLRSLNMTLHKLGINLRQLFWFIDWDLFKLLKLWSFDKMEYMKNGT